MTKTITFRPVPRNYNDDFGQLRVTTDHHAFREGKLVATIERHQSGWAAYSADGHALGLRGHTLPETKAKVVGAFNL